jgi:DNA-binding HxlR family transcriptional regulator
MAMKLPILTVPRENACGCSDRAASGDHECLCPTTGLVQIIGRRYALTLLAMIAERGAVRFNEIKTSLDDMSSSTLTIRLVELEQAGLIERQPFAEMPPRVEYSVTEAGDQLRKHLISLSRSVSQK